MSFLVRKNNVLMDASYDTCGSDRWLYVAAKRSAESYKLSFIGQHPFELADKGELEIIAAKGIFSSQELRERNSKGLVDDVLKSNPMKDLDMCRCSLEPVEILTFYNKPMTKQEALEKIEELKKFVEESDKKKGRFRAKIGEGYWYIASDGDVYDDVERVGEVSTARFAIGNYYETEEQAEKEVARRKVIAKLCDLNEGFEPDWEDGEQRKYSLALNHCWKRWVIYIFYSYQTNFGLPYFASEEALQNAIDTLGDELDVLLD